MGTNQGDKLTYTRHFWAKSDRANPGRIHLLEHHLADVGAVFEALLRQPTIRNRLARSAGLADLDEVTVARLAVFAALHDIGKVNTGFQAQIWDIGQLPRQIRNNRHVGHTSVLSPVLGDSDSETAEWFFDGLGWWEHLIDWGDQDGETVAGLFIATLSHHGRPFQCNHPGYGKNTSIWKPFRGLHPQRQVERIGRLIRVWFPSAFEQGGTPLPAAPRFQHHFLGLCTLADWIGSNEKWFGYVDEPQDDYVSVARARARRAINTVGLDVDEQRHGLSGVPGFEELFIDIEGPPNAIQDEAALRSPLEQPVVIIESETGSGKTEAALWRFAKMYGAGLVDGLYFALPTRSAAVQIHRRVSRFVERLFTSESRPEVVLAIPGFVREQDFTERHLPDYSVWWDGSDTHTGPERPWATENPKRFLTAQIAVGTVDQVMLGSLRVRHAHLRSSSLARNLLVVDEVHASDTYMARVLSAVLDAHIGAGGYALLMSATLGSTARNSWLAIAHGSDPSTTPFRDAIKVPYPAVSRASKAGQRLSGTGWNNQQKRVDVTTSRTGSDFSAVAGGALDAARRGAKVLVVRNTVRYAVETHLELEKLAGDDEAHLLFSVNGQLALHHSGFASEDRRLLDSAVEAVVGRKRDHGGRVIVGTQTLEQSLDIDADLLITDLCPMDVLLQRIGRLHRHRRDDRPAEFRSPTCVVLIPNGDDLSHLLSSGEEANGLGPNGYVYVDLRVLEATRQMLIDNPTWSIPRMNRQLVEGATHPHSLSEIVKEKGEAWMNHANEMTVSRIAADQLGSYGVIRRDETFYAGNSRVLFPSSEEHIRTRLGDDSVDIHLKPTASSPFDASKTVERISVSVRWLGGAQVPETVTPTKIEGGIEFSVGERGFRYTRLGIART